MAAGIVRMLWKSGDLGVEVKMMMMYEGVVVAMGLYGAETWGL